VRRRARLEKIFRALQQNVPSLRFLTALVIDSRGAVNKALVPRSCNRHVALPQI